VWNELFFDFPDVLNRQIMAASVIRIKPNFYAHVLDNNTNIVRVEVGPQTFTRSEQETLVSGPEQQVMIPPRHYCIIQVGDASVLVFLPCVVS
jgi:hypothetical protein